MDLTTGEGKLRAVNFLLPYVQKIPNRILRSEWASRIAQHLRLDEPVLRAALSKAAAERRVEVKTQPELISPAVKKAERRLIRILSEADELRRSLAKDLQAEQLYLGLEGEKIFAALIIASSAGEQPQPLAIAEMLNDRERKLFFEILFEQKDASEATEQEANNCLQALRRRRIQQDLTEVQQMLLRAPACGPETNALLEKKQELQRRLDANTGWTAFGGPTPTQ
jgi:DNA primase